MIHRAFYETRKSLSRKLQNPNFMKITFKTFRHWKATIEYHRTKDILYVKELLGHKQLLSWLALGCFDWTVICMATSFQDSVSAGT